MSKLVPATYRDVESIDSAQSIEYFERMLDGAFPAFVVRAAGKNLRSSLVETNLTVGLARLGLHGEIKEAADFRHNTKNLLPRDLTGIKPPTGEGWWDVGVTALHVDETSDMPLSMFSINHTQAGIAEFRLHQVKANLENFIDQWDILDRQTATILWESNVDPESLVPEGYKTVVNSGDLFVFDTSYAHMVQSLETPRLSEAVFYSKV